MPSESNLDEANREQKMDIENKKRIEFIDLAKGMCILLIILGHTGVAVDYPGLTAMRTPLYLTLSGLFFKDYGSFGHFLKRKTNRVLVPFIFFYTASYAIFHTVNIVAPGLIISDATNIFDLFTQGQYFNGPLWFLLAIFWSNILFYCIYANIKQELLRATAVLCCAAAGLWLVKEHIFLPCFLDTTLVGLPFFYFGYQLRKSSILYPSKHDRFNIPVSLVLFGCAYIIDSFAHPTMFFHDKEFAGSIFSMAALPIASVMALLLLCKAIGKLPVISYIGRYSIIPLCTHHLIYRPIALVVYRFIAPENGGSYIVALSTIIICLAIIPLMVRYIPQFTAQKDLIE